MIKSYIGFFIFAEIKGRVLARTSVKPSSVTFYEGSPTFMQA